MLKTTEKLIKNCAITKIHGSNLSQPLQGFYFVDLPCPVFKVPFSPSTFGSARSSQFKRQIDCSGCSTVASMCLKSMYSWIKHTHIVVRAELWHISRSYSKTHFSIGDRIIWDVSFRVKLVAHSGSWHICLWNEIGLTMIKTNMCAF